MCDMLGGLQGASAACAVTGHEERLQGLIIKEDAVLSELLLSSRCKESMPHVTGLGTSLMQLSLQAGKLRKQAGSIKALRAANEQQECTISEQAGKLEEAAGQLAAR